MRCTAGTGGGPSGCRLPSVVQSFVRAVVLLPRVRASAAEGSRRPPTAPCPAPRKAPVARHPGPSARGRPARASVCRAALPAARGAPAKVPQDGVPRQPTAGDQRPHTSAPVLDRHVRPFPARGPRPCRKNRPPRRKTLRARRRGGPCRLPPGGRRSQSIPAKTPDTPTGSHGLPGAPRPMRGAWGQVSSLRAQLQLMDPALSHTRTGPPKPEPVLVSVHNAERLAPSLN